MWLSTSRENRGISDVLQDADSYAAVGEFKNLIVTLGISVTSPMLRFHL